MHTGAAALILSFLLTGSATAAIELSLQTRRGEGDLVTAKEQVDPAKIGVIVDMWNTNDCMTTTAQRTAPPVAPRMNKAIECARRLAVEVIWRRPTWRANTPGCRNANGP